MDEPTVELATGRPATPPDGITITLTEPAAAVVTATTAGAHGIPVTLDHVGDEPDSLAFLPLIAPAVIRLGEQVLHHPYTAATIDTITAATTYAERTGAVIVATGIASAADAHRARTLGARWGQGPLYTGQARPARPASRRPAILHAEPRCERDRSPYALATACTPGRPADPDATRAYAEHLLHHAAGEHGVVLASTNDPATLQRWLPPLAGLVAQVAHVGLATDRDDVATPPGAHRMQPGAQHPARRETTLVVTGPHTTAALCITAAGFALTRDPDAVHAIGRLLLHHCEPAPVRVTAELQGAVRR